MDARPTPRINALDRDIRPGSEETGFSAYMTMFAEARQLERSNAELVEALQFLYDETMDYIILNKLGAHNNQSLQKARTALRNAGVE